MKGYEEILPGAADRILKMAEEQSRHRQQLERDESQANIRAVKRGSIFAFIMSLAIIGAGTYLIATGKDVTGLAMILANIGALASVFIVGRAKEKRSKISQRIKEKQDLPNSTDVSS